MKQTYEKIVVQGDRIKRKYSKGALVAKDMLVGYHMLDEESNDKARLKHIGSIVTLKPFYLDTRIVPLICIMSTSLLLSALVIYYSGQLDSLATKILLVFFVFIVSFSLYNWNGTHKILLTRKGVQEHNLFNRVKKDFPWEAIQEIGFARKTHRAERMSERMEEGYIYLSDIPLTEKDRKHIRWRKRKHVILWSYSYEAHAILYSCCQQWGISEEKWNSLVAG